MTTRYAMQLAYEGTDFCGWQAQPTHDKPSIEGTIVAAIHDLCQQDVTVTSSGRTDAGAHAHAQIAHIDLKDAAKPFAEDTLQRGLNDRLPKSVQILKLAAVPATFHAKQATRKQYSFYYQLGPAPLPHLRNTVVWNRHPLNHNLMHRAAQALLGEHNFTAFCSTSAQANSTTREIYEAQVTQEPTPLPGLPNEQALHLLRIRLVGSGFLKHMVRRIAGTLKRIGQGHLELEALADILESRDSERSLPIAPAHGLWLDQVWYPEQDDLSFLTQN